MWTSLRPELELRTLHHLSPGDFVPIVTNLSVCDYVWITCESRPMIGTSNAARNIPFTNVVHR